MFKDHLDKYLKAHPLSEKDDLLGFKIDFADIFPDKGPFRFVADEITDDPTKKLIFTFNVTHFLNLTVLKEKIVRIWNEDLTYEISDYEFHDESNCLVFNFFTLEMSIHLFTTGQAKFFLP